MPAVLLGHEGCLWCEDPAVVLVLPCEAAGGCCTEQSVVWSKVLAEDLVTVPVALRFSNHSFVQKVFVALGRRVALLAAAPLHQSTAQRDERRLLRRLRKAPACPPQTLACALRAGLQ